MSLIKMLELDTFDDKRGQLNVIEANRCIPFDIKRVYYMTGTKTGASRGFHAHEALEQVAVCVSGACRVLLDNGVQRENVILSSPVKAVRIEKMVWHEMHDFTADCVLLVLASDYYDESDYIRNYDQFLERI